jgi:hypothetical protein
MKIVTLFNNKKHFDIAPCSFERSLTFREIAELPEECESVYRKIRSENSFTPPLTFVVPAQQVVASISRFVE